MATPRQIANEKLQRLEDIPANLATVVTRVQQQLLSGAITQISALETGADGRLILNDDNLAAISRILDDLSITLNEGEYIDAVISFASEFNKSGSLNIELVSELLGQRVTDRALWQNTLQRAQANAIQLLSDEALNVEFINPLRVAMESSIEGGATIPETIRSISLDIVGGKIGDREVEGTLLRHVKQTTRTAFQIADRSHLAVVSSDLGFVFYRWDGKPVKGSREFCLARKGKVFHIEEIRIMGAPDFSGIGTTQPGQWNGRIATTNPGNMPVFLGGWGCLDILIPVVTSDVSESTKKRVSAKGLSF